MKQGWPMSWSFLRLVDKFMRVHFKTLLNCSLWNGWFVLCEFHTHACAHKAPEGQILPFSIYWWEISCNLFEATQATVRLSLRGGDSKLRRMEERWDTICRLHMEFIGLVGLGFLFSFSFFFFLRFSRGTHVFLVQVPKHRMNSVNPTINPSDGSRGSRQATSMRDSTHCGKVTTGHTHTPPPTSPSGYCRCGGRKVSILQHALFFPLNRPLPLNFCCLWQMF